MSAETKNGRVGRASSPVLPHLADSRTGEDACSTVLPRLADSRTGEDARPTVLPHLANSRTGGTPVPPAGRQIPAFLWLGLLAALSLFGELGCKPKESAQRAGETVSGYAKEMGSAAGRLSTKAGEKLGLVEKRHDYVRRAWGPGEKAAEVAAGYTLEEEREVGRALAAEIFKRHRAYENEKLEAYLNRIAAGLCAFSDRPALPCGVAVLRSEELSAWGLPGGFLLVTLGSLRACESESELAGLLASALAQAQLRHVLALVERLRAELLPGHTAEPATQAADHDFTILMETAAGQLLREGSTAAETRACDRMATDLLIRLGYEPGGLKAYWARARLRLQAQTGPGPLREHAALKVREQAIDERLGELHALSAGRTLADRFRRECVSSLPAPQDTP